MATFRSLTILVLSLALLASAASAGALRQLTWDDLVPEQPPMADPFTDLSMDQRVLLAGIAGILAALREGQVSAVSPEYEMAVEDKATLAKQGLDVDALLLRFDAFDAEIQRRNAAVVGALDGQLVRMPGYALPLEFTDAGVSEFLLVPYIGACIHVPPPPPNQTVLVKLNQSFIAKDLYEPVWITGKLRVEKTSSALSLVDGSADVAAGYVLHGTKVEPYEE